MFLDLTKTYLMRELHNVEVISFMNPITLLDYLSESKVDLIISDYQMDELTGLEVLKKVRENSLDIPFIIFTGKGREEVVIDALNLGADYYLQKGLDIHISMTELINFVNKEVSKSSEKALRLKVENSLKESQEQLNIIVDNLSESIALLKPEGNDKFRVISVNDPFLTRTGYLRENVLGKTIDEFLPPQSYLSTVEVFHKAIKERKTYQQLLGNDPDGMYQTYDTPIFNSENPNKCDYILRVAVKIDIKDIMK
jgi:PAS domain S-box-containing protein